MSFHGEDSENVNPDIPDEQKPILERLRHLSGEMDPMALDLNQLTSSNSIRLNFGLPACPGQKGPSKPPPGFTNKSAPPGFTAKSNLISSPPPLPSQSSAGGIKLGSLPTSGHNSQTGALHSPAPASGLQLGSLPPSGSGLQLGSLPTSGSGLQLGSLPPSGSGSQLGSLPPSGSGLQLGSLPPSGSGLQLGSLPPSGSGLQLGSLPPSGSLSQCGPGQGLSLSSLATTHLASEPQKPSAGLQLGPLPGLQLGSGSRLQLGSLPPTGCGLKLGSLPSSGSGFQPGSLSSLGSGQGLSLSSLATNHLTSVGQTSSDPPSEVSLNGAIKPTSSLATLAATHLSSSARSDTKLGGPLLGTDTRDMKPLEKSSLSQMSNIAAERSSSPAEQQEIDLLSALKLSSEPPGDTLSVAPSDDAFIPQSNAVQLNIFVSESSFGKAKSLLSRKSRSPMATVLTRRVVIMILNVCTLHCSVMSGGGPDE